MSHPTKSPGYKRVSQLIEDSIIEGELQHGDVLPIESEMAEQLGVNRSTVREGLRSLENAGLIRRGRGKRMQVSVPDSADIAWINTRALGLRRVSFQDLWNIQMSLEPLCARLAATNMSEELAAGLRSNLQATEARLEDDDALILLDVEFHSLVAEASGNQALPITTAPIEILLFGATQNLYRTVRAARHRLLEAHRNILAALLNRDPAEAERWMIRHIEDFRRGYELGGLDMNEPITIRSHRALNGTRL